MLVKFISRFLSYFSGKMNFFDSLTSYVTPQMFVKSRNIFMIIDHRYFIEKTINNRFSIIIDNQNNHRPSLYTIVELKILSINTSNIDDNR